MRERKMGASYLVRLETDEAISASLTAFAADRRIDVAYVSGIGAAHDVELGFYDREKKEYSRRTVAEEMEIISLSGNLSIREGRAFPHLHIVLGSRDYQALAGHLFEGRVGGTCELIVTPLPGYVQRVQDAATGLFLLDL